MTVDARGNRQIAALTIAGSDSGGNAGIQADIRAFHVFGLHACTVLTALTAQNPSGVRSVVVQEPAFIEDQLDAVLEAYEIGALKTGMLASAEVIAAVAGRIGKQVNIQKVVDPVMVATSGAKLLRDDAIDAIKTLLLPLATLITPNLPEAGVLLGHEIRTREEMALAAEALSGQFGCAVLVKGGHQAENVAEDVLVENGQRTWYATPAILNPRSTHGTGCSLSAAIAASLAIGRDLRTAVAEGKAYVYESIRTGISVGPHATVLGTPSRLEDALKTVTIRLG